MMYRCPACKNSVPFYAVHPQDLTERSAKGPCCLARSGPLTTDLLEHLRIVAGSPSAPTQISPHEALVLWADFKLSQTYRDEHPAPDPVPDPVPDPAPPPSLLPGPPSMAPIFPSSDPV